MAKWIEDPQGRLEVEKVTEELKLPVWKPSYKGKFREFWNECWEKIENAYLKLKKSVDGKEPAITKKSGFNLEKTDSFQEDDTNKLATAKALKSLSDKVDKKTGAIKLNWDSITDKPSSFPPSEHNHNSLYYTEDEVDEKLENNILYCTGKTYGGLLNIPGTKEVGKTYFDKNTKKLYLCKNNNIDISANINNYIAMDSYSLFERLENFFSFQEINSEPLLININNPIRKFKIPDCKFVMVEIDLYSNDPKLYSKTTKVIPYFALKAGKKFYHSDNTGNYELSEIWLSGDEINIKANNTVIYIGAIFTI